MGDSERPTPLATDFEIPDLDLGPLAAPRARAPHVTDPRPRSVHAFEQPGALDADDGLESKSSGLELAEGVPSGSTFERLGNTFDEARFETGSFGAAALELEPVTSFAGPDPATSEAMSLLGNDQSLAVVTTPSFTGAALDVSRVHFDPSELRSLSGYPLPPSAVQLTPAYALRVFLRQRGLKEELRVLQAESERAERERADVLAELARALRSEAQGMAALAAQVARLSELESAVRAHAERLASSNAKFETESSQLGESEAALTAELIERSAALADGERIEAARRLDVARAEAKRRRVQIEARARGSTPDPERTASARAELAHAEDALARAVQTLGEGRARLEVTRRRERETAARRQALLGRRHLAETSLAREHGEPEVELRAALIELGRALLAAPGRASVPSAWLERVQSVGERADRLLVRCEMQRRTLTAYDAPRAKQGVRLTCTVLGLLVVLLSLKLAL